MFALVVFCYAPISLMRTVTFNLYWALLDQWMTVPWFGFVFAWGIALIVYEAFELLPQLSKYKSKSGWYALMVFAALISLSAASYPIATMKHPLGFEICIGLHVIGVLLMGIYHVYRKPSLRWPFITAVSACCGFIVMKQLDLVLAELYAPLFRLFSGHFFSKLCDALQLHLVLNFFYRYCIESSSAQSSSAKRSVSPRRKKSPQRRIIDAAVPEVAPMSAIASGR